MTPLTMDELGEIYRRTMVGGADVRPDLYEAIQDLVDRSYDAYSKAIAEGAPDVIEDGLRDQYSKARNLARRVVEARAHYIAKQLGPPMPRSATEEERQLYNRVREVLDTFQAEVVRL
jgi:DNA replication initiation complex subunit (GINS family)